MEISSTILLRCVKILPPKYYDQLNNLKLGSFCSQYNLVCGDEAKLPLIQSVFFLGVFIGAFVFGYIADLFVFLVSFRFKFSNFSFTEWAANLSTTSILQS